MPDQLTECARKAAEETLNSFPFKPYVDSRACHKCFLKVDDIAAIIERHMREYEGMKMTEASIKFLEERDVEFISDTITRRELLEQALSDAYAKLDEAKGILGKVL